MTHKIPEATTMGADDVDRSNRGEGRYANYAEIGHNAYEFVFDFGQVWLDGDPAMVYVRVVTNPETAQRLYGALDNALSAYRTTFGVIRRHPHQDPHTED
jgi:hypothetical protein